MLHRLEDKRRKVTIINKTTSPQHTMALAAKGCYSEGLVVDDYLNADPDQMAWLKDVPSLDFRKREKSAFNWLNDAVLKKKHFGILEHASISLLIQGYNKNSVMQLRTHRNASFAVQSGRYSGKRFLDDKYDVDDLYWYLSEEESNHKDRSGASYSIDRNRERSMQYFNRQQFRNLVKANVPMEQARDILGSGIRTDFTMSCNLRTLFHIFALRTPLDAQLDVRLMMDHISHEIIKSGWCQEMMIWHRKKYYGKSTLAF